MSKKYYKTTFVFYCVGERNVQCFYSIPRKGFYTIQTKITLKEWQDEIENLENDFKEITEQEYKKELKSLISKIVNML